MRLPIRYYTKSPNNVWDTIDRDESELRGLNENGHDIFWVYNGMVGEFRRKEGIRQINAFFVDVDSVPKNKLVEIIKENLTPSTIIETKRGFHMYWDLKEPIDTSDDPVKWADWFCKFIKTRMLPVYNGDPRAADVVRLMRVPMFRYWKDKSGDEIKLIYGNEFSYTLDEIEKSFPVLIEDKIRLNQPLEPSIADTENQKYWFQRLSGTPEVLGEIYSFRKNSNGTEQVMVNGKPSSCWIDKNGRIGSSHEGGPTIVQWLSWVDPDTGLSKYNFTTATAFDLIRRLNAPQGSR